MNISFWKNTLVISSPAIRIAFVPSYLRLFQTKQICFFSTLPCHRLGDDFGAGGGANSPYQGASSRNGRMDCAAVAAKSKREADLEVRACGRMRGVFITLGRDLRQLNLFVAAGRTRRRWFEALSRISGKKMARCDQRRASFRSVGTRDFCFSICLSSRYLLTGKDEQ